MRTAQTTTFQSLKEIFQHFVATDGAGGDGIIIEWLFAIRIECWRQLKGAKA
jgi:hypothetical protein